MGARVCAVQAGRICAYYRELIESELQVKEPWAIVHQFHEFIVTQIDQSVNNLTCFFIILYYYIF
jgi:hypothetical protein